MVSLHRILPISLLLLLTVQIPSFAQIEEGDTLSFWSVAYIDWDPGYPIDQRQVSAVCNRVGDQCYLFVDTEVISVPDPGRIDALVDIYDTNFSQDLPPLYEENSSLYVFTHESFARHQRRIGAKPRFFPVSRIEATDIDDEFTFRLAELLALYAGVSNA